MKKLLFYLIFTVVNLILIILDILRPFLGLVRILAYCNLLGSLFAILFMINCHLHSS